MLTIEAHDIGLNATVIKQGFKFFGFVLQKGKKQTKIEDLKLKEEP